MKKTFFLLLLVFTKFLYSQNEPTLAWGKAVNNSGQSGVQAMTTDRFGNIYVTGNFSTSITVNGHTITNYTPSGGRPSNYLIKYDSMGNGIWAKKIPFSAIQLVINGDDLYMVGIYLQDVYQYQGIPLPLPHSSIGAYLIAKSDLNNNVEWVNTIDSRGGVAGAYIQKYISLFIGNNDKVHALGIFSSTVDFNNGSTLSVAGGTDAFHAVFDTLGGIISTQKLGVVDSVVNFYTLENFTMDKQNNIYRYSNRIHKLIKYDEQGNSLFENSYNPTGGVGINGITTDLWGNVLLAGYFTSSSMTFGGISLSSYGNTDAILTKINGTNGNVFWTKSLEWSGADLYDYVKSDDIGNIYTMSKRGYGGLYPTMPLLTKFDTNGIKIWQKSFIAAGNGYQSGQNYEGTVFASSMAFNLNGGNILVAGSFRSGIKFDDTHIINPNSNTGTDFWGFIAQYGICNTPQPTLTVSNAQFCQGDSAMLSVTTTPGYSYLWSNGDTTNTTIYVNSSGKYSVIAIQDEECYAESQEFYITEHPLPDTSVILQTATLTAVSGNTYQWLDCDNGLVAINGATAASFTPIQNGTYAVEVTSPAGCTDTSSCFTINNLSVNDISLNQLISIYPNPAKDEINIEGVSNIKSVRILDLQGKELMHTKGDKVTISTLSSGVYLIEIRTAKGVGVKRFVKE